LISKALRSSDKIDEEERDVQYEKYSLTNLQLITVFLIQISHFFILGITLAMIYYS